MLIGGGDESKEQLGAGVVHRREADLVDEDEVRAQDLLNDVWPLFEDRRLAPPPIHARFALTAASDAHALMESGAHIGKIVLLVGHPAT